jgi:hypothetical protein
MGDEKQEKKGLFSRGPSNSDIYAELNELKTYLTQYLTQVIGDYSKKNEESVAYNQVIKKIDEINNKLNELNAYNQGINNRLNALEGVVKNLDIEPYIKKRTELEEDINNLRKQYEKEEKNLENIIAQSEKLKKALDYKVKEKEKELEGVEKKLKEEEGIFKAIIEEYKTFPDALYSGYPNIEFQDMWGTLCMMEWHEIKVKHIAFASFYKNILLNGLYIACHPQLSLDEKKKIIEILYEVYETWGVARTTHPDYIDYLIEQNVGISPEDEDRRKKQQAIFNKYRHELESYLKSPDEEMIRKEANELAGIFEEKRKKSNSVITRIFISVFQKMLKEPKFEDKLRVLVPIGKAFKEWLDIGSTYPINR